MMTSQVLRKLQDRNLIERTVDPADSRALRITVTNAGRKALTGAMADVEGVDESFFEKLGSRRTSFAQDLLTLIEESRPHPPAG